jgi:hypothetical protein
MAEPNEHQRRQSNEDRLLAFFEAHPMVWIEPKHGLEQAAGRYAWRSRLPKVRKRIQGVIRWNHKNGEGTAYMFTPYVPIAPPADQPRSGQLTMFR